MDADEVLAMFVAGAVALLGAARWYMPLLTVRTYRNAGALRTVLTLTPAACLAIVWLVLAHWSAREVRDSAAYQLLFLLGDGAWLTLTAGFLLLLGLSPRDDAIEASNAAAVVVVCGAFLATSFCYAGANVGEGPTIWTTFIPAAVASGWLFLLWVIYELHTRASEAVAVARDVASGWRLAGWLVAAGLVLGRAAAGDFHSWHQTISDFLWQGWPAVPIMLAAAAMQRVWRPTPKQPTHPTAWRGLLPAATLVSAALTVLFILGRPDLRPLPPRVPEAPVTEE